MRSRKQLALLAYLVSQYETPINRDVLMGLLWPDETTADAQNNLRVTLSRLREVVNKIGAHNGELFIVDRNTVQLNPAWIQRVDANRFEHLLVRTRQHNHTQRSQCLDCQAALQEAVRLYEGDFLHGLVLEDCNDFAEWLFVQRERMRTQVLEAYADLATFDEANGRLSAALEYAQAQIAMDPLRESAYRLHMRVLARSGDRNGALAVYARCHAAVHEALGIEPEPETQHLHAQILAGDTAGALPNERILHLGHNLPQHFTSFFGRDEELAQLHERLQSSAYRLISLIGPGGVGKTRLAQQAAAQHLAFFRDGVFFVGLAQVATAEAIPSAIAEALGIVRTSGSQSVLAQLIAQIGNRHMLIVLDNFEHLLNTDDALARHSALAPAHDEQSATDCLMDLLQRAPNIHLVITSRERLNLQAEDLFQLGGLSLPDGAPDAPIDPSIADRYATVRLFCDRAYRVSKSFKLTHDNVAAVVRICRWLQGNPLGIELAATWIRRLSCAELADALESDADMLQTDLRDVPPQHRSMRAMFDQSWRLLAPSERTLLARLALFRGGFTLVAATHVAEATLMMLIRLRYKSLLQTDGAGRYDVHELLRQFALERFAQIETEQAQEDVRWRYSEYYLKLIAEREKPLRGRQPRDVLSEIRVDLENVREAWRWAASRLTMDSRGIAEVMLSSIEGLRQFFALSGMHAEAERTFGLALQCLADTDAHSLLRLSLSLAMAWTLIRQTRLNVAATYVETALQLTQTIDDDRMRARGQFMLGWLLAEQGNPSAAVVRLEQALLLARRARDLALDSEVLRYLGNVLNHMGERARATTVLQQARQIENALGNAAHEQTALLYLGAHMAEQGDFVQARTYLEEALRLVPHTGARSAETRVENTLGFVEAQTGNFALALSHHEQSRRIAHEIGEPTQESHALHNLCTVSRKLGQFAEAEQYGREALRVAVENSSPDAEAYAWLHLGYVWVEMNALDMAHHAFTRSRDRWRKFERGALAIEATVGLAEVAFRRGAIDDALTQVNQALTYQAQHGFAGTDEPQQMQRTIQRILAAV